MSSQLLSVVGTSGVVTQIADEAASNGTVPLRDSSGNLAAGNVVTATTTLVSSAGLILKSTAKSANFTASKTESTFYVVDTTSGSVTVTLPSAAASAGVVFGFIKPVAANSLILDGASSETINGATTKTSATQWASCIIWCDGTSWYQTAIAGTWT